MTQKAELKNIILDLDDTLLETSRLLVPIAEKQACDEMIKLGLQCQTQDCITYRNQVLNQFSGFGLFQNIVKKFNPNLDNNISQTIAQKGFEIFYNPAVPKQLPIRDGALDFLKYLTQKRYQLFLVTAGVPQTQIKKIKSLEIEHFFNKTFLVDIKMSTKKDAFLEIISQTKCQPSECISIGNRFSDEIIQALNIGMQACWMPYGEHKNEDATNISQKFYKAGSFKEVIEICRL